ncbi:MAG: type VI secretion system tip protein TssI/VgrG [Pseudomonadota bacterium]
MSFLTERKYSFASNALSADAFAVVGFTGEEGLSRPYRFDVRLAAADAEIDLGAVMSTPATFTIHRDAGADVSFSGILADFEQQHAVDDVVFYRATLVPKLWWLSLTRHNQVFLDKTVKGIVEAVLKDSGLTSLDYEFRLKSDYAPQPYVCQYGESHLNFIDRWLAREGIYYYFEQTQHGEKIIFTDTAIAHRESRHGWDLTYAPPSELGDAHRDESVQGFVCRQNLMPKSIMLKDTNYEKPSLEVIGRAEVDANGRGEQYIYGEHFKTPEDGDRLAGIRAQTLLCRKQDFVGESTVPYVEPGFTFTLQGHNRGSFNQKYLTIGMTHAGSQTGYLIAGIQKGLSERERTVAYRNQFTAIPAGVQFRAPQSAAQPKIDGTLNARIDAAGSGTYAELDEQGRYKVILPFDTSERKNGKASTWLRMAQPYAGSGHGMHFPLHKGTEVLLTFIEGNPDRPVIAAAVPNPETDAVVTGDNQTMAALTTSGGNQIHMEDKAGSERILLHAPKQSSFVRIGAHNDPPAAEEYKSSSTHWGIAKATDGWLDVEAKAKNEIILGQSFDWVTGPRVYFTAGLFNDTAIGGTLEVHAPEEMSLTPFGTDVEMEHLGAAGTRTVTRIASSRMDTTEESVRGDTNSAVNSRLDAVAGKVQAVGAKARASGEQVRADAATLHVTGQKIQAVEDKLAATATALETAGATMKDAGTRLRATGVFSQILGTAVEDNGDHLESAGADIGNAGVILEGL